MVNMLQISSSKKLRWGKLDDIAYTFVDIASSKTLYEKPQRKNSHKEKSTMYRMFQYYPPKTSMGKMDDRT